MILADTYVLARMMNRASLTNDDVTSLSYLTAKKLNTQSLALRLAAVLRTTYTFFMCHFFLLL